MGQNEPDRRLRAAFRIPPGSAERLVDRALGESSEREAVVGERLAAFAAVALLALGLTAAQHLLDEYRSRGRGVSAGEGRKEKIVIISGSRTDRPEILIVEHGGTRE